MFQVGDELIWKRNNSSRYRIVEIKDGRCILYSYQEKQVLTLVTPTLEEVEKTYRKLNKLERVL